MLSVIRQLADSRAPGSLAVRLRRKRMADFALWLRHRPAAVRVLDVGGEQVFWERMDLAHERGVRFEMLNIAPQQVSLPNFSLKLGTALDLPYPDQSFDVVFSNALLQMIGGRDSQMRVAAEIRRVGRRYFVQAPSRWFPIHPHFMLPYFQFLPHRLQVGLLTHFRLTHVRKRMPPADADAFSRSIRLLTMRDLRIMFPEATITRERLFGWTKSYLVSHGLEVASHEPGHIGRPREGPAAGAVQVPPDSQGAP